MTSICSSVQALRTSVLNSAILRLRADAVKPWRSLVVVLLVLLAASGCTREKIILIATPTSAPPVAPVVASPTLSADQVAFIVGASASPTAQPTMAPFPTQAPIVVVVEVTALPAPPEPTQPPPPPPPAEHLPILRVSGVWTVTIVVTDSYGSARAIGTRASRIWTITEGEGCPGTRCKLTIVSSSDAAFSGPFDSTTGTFYPITGHEPTCPTSSGMISGHVDEDVPEGIGFKATRFSGVFETQVGWAGGNPQPCGFSFEKSSLTAVRSE